MSCARSDGDQHAVSAPVKHRGFVQHLATARPCTVLGHDDARRSSSARTSRRAAGHRGRGRHVVVDHAEVDGRPVGRRRVAIGLCTSWRASVLRLPAGCADAPHHEEQSSCRRDPPPNPHVSAGYAKASISGRIGGTRRSCERVPRLTSCRVRQRRGLQHDLELVGAQTETMCDSRLETGGDRRVHRALRQPPARLLQCAGRSGRQTTTAIGRLSTKLVVTCPPISMRTQALITYELNSAHRKCWRSIGTARLEAEERVRRDDAGGNDGRDEREGVADCRHVAVGEPRPIERRARQSAAAAAGRSIVPPASATATERATRVCPR